MSPNNDSNQGLSVVISTKEILTAQRNWWTPAGLLVSFVATLCTADFKEALGGSKEFWHAIFVLLTISSAVWLLISLRKLYRNWGQDNLENIIEKIKLKSTSPLANETIVIEQNNILLDVPIDNSGN
jgi:hypothetical protein